MKTPSTFYLVLLLGMFLLNAACSKDDGPEAPPPAAEEQPKEEEKPSEEEEPANRAPEPFNLIGVTDGAVGVDVYPTFSWQAAKDPDGDAITYDLYLGKEEDPTELYTADLTSTSFEVTERLHTYDFYYWKVVAKDPENATMNSTVNEFSVRGLKFDNTPVTAAAAFSGRSSHTTAVFDNKMWVIGGFDDSNKNDVWYSADGLPMRPLFPKELHTPPLFLITNYGS